MSRNFLSALSKLVRIEGIAALTAMTSLVLSYNRIHDTSGFSELGCGNNSLKTLDLRDNRIATLDQLDNLSGFLVDFLFGA